MSDANKAKQIKSDCTKQITELSLWRRDEISRLEKINSDLLEACKELYENYKRDAKCLKVMGSPHVQYAFKLAESAIAKAEGRS